MSREQISRRWRRLLERLSQPAPVLVDLALMVIAIGASIVAMVRCECRDCRNR